MRIPSSFVVLVAGLSVGVAIGCSDGDGNGDLGSAYLNKLKACGLISEGELPSADEEELDPQVSCYLECLLDATCVEVQALTCDPTSVMPSEQLVACYENCEATTGDPDFVCGDGDSIPSDWECDGTPDCADGTDEVDCVTFECVDGMGTVPEAEVCDGNPNCTDGSDELGCPGYTMCADGVGSYPEDAACDGSTYCADGSDELGCPTYACANGEKAVAGKRCDFTADCEDGSDEEGCAQLLCPE